MYKIIGIDPSSTAIGVAVLDEQGKLLDGKLITPSNAKEPFYMRVSDMMLDLEDELINWMPRYIAIEIPSLHKENRKAQARYGFGAGAAWLCAKTHQKLYGRADPCTIKVYDAQEWTHGARKRDRAVLTDVKHRAYHMDKDKGFDVADAIQLAESCLEDVQMAARMEFAEHKTPLRRQEVDDGGHPIQEPV